MADTAMNINTEAVIDKLKRINTCVDSIAERANDYNTKLDEVTVTKLDWVLQVDKLAKSIASSMKLIQDQLVETQTSIDALVKMADEANESDGSLHFD